MSALFFKPTETTLILFLRAFFLKKIKKNLYQGYKKTTRFNVIYYLAFRNAISSKLLKFSICASATFVITPISGFNLR